MSALWSLVNVSAGLADISTASTARVASPVSGKLYTAVSCLQGAITGSDCTWSMTINGVAVPGSTVTVAVADSAAGTVDLIDFHQMDPPIVNKGDTIGFVSAGESSTTAAVQFSAVVRT
ncbi:hypothetical protein [Bradyrhizobium sp. AUGA SZCCT0431]|uniref:hypothetical protein n=1 Tax=Bradyrhizobium sp. AUGA SZCCT0431 TaxID=2807674 RepID=UPI001BA85683|nr:hypothetical protein [Bradyrhizobium sp. AUGA SZCCT0431]MBR1145084.1 hypothetical protein [Bradyrhizobium sp. AUGA SZCCT0431]